MVSRVGARDLAVDISYPAANALGAAVILLHGGGWLMGHRGDMADYARSLTDMGFTTIAAEYRLLGEAPWPAQIVDVKDVFAWTVEHAEELGVTADKIALMGMSAGGHLALLAAGTQTLDPFGADRRSPPANVAAVVSAFAPAELHLPPPGAGFTPVKALLGPDATAESARAASPMSYVGPEFPPTFLISGTKDKMLPHQVALDMFAALDRAGVATELHLFCGHTHEFTRLPSMLAPVMAEVALFLKRTVVDPAFYTHENATLNPFSQPGFPPLPPGTNPALPTH